jgi:hypothetical protein
MKRRTFNLRAGRSIDLHLSGPCSILQAAEAEPKRLPTFSMVAYTGTPMRPKMDPPLKHPVVVDLAGLQAQQTRPVLKDHDSRAMVGHTTRISNDGRQLTAEGVISGTGPAAREVVQAAKNGFTWQVSIGAQVGDLEFFAAHQTTQVNGQLVAGPVYVARSGRVREISFLTLGADDSTSARIAAEAAKGTPMSFEQWLQAKGFELGKISDQQKTYLQAQYTAETADQDDEEATVEAADEDAEDEAPDAVAAERKRLLDERKRLSGITTLTAKYAKRMDAEKLSTLEAQAIEEAWDADRYELQLLRDARPQHGNGGSGGGNNLRLDAAVVEAALCLSAGIAEESVAKSVDAAQRERVMNAASASPMRGYSLHALMDAVIHAAGSYYGGSRRSNDYIRTAMTAERTLQASGFSTVSLSGIMANVANKGLIAAYSAVNVVWNQICGIRNHGDFKVHTRYRLDSTGAFRKVASDGELKHVGLSDASYTNQLATYGAIVALTRQMMINDDLGAFMEIPALLGRMAALRLEEAVFVLLLSNPSSFFAAGNRNLTTGAASALSITALTTAEQKFLDQVDSNNKPVLVSPVKLLVGSPLSVTARNLFTEQQIIATGLASTASKTIEPAKNPHVGKYTPVTSPYISNTNVKDQDGAAISGQSSTIWWLLADPAVRAAIAVAFLNGQQTPTIESAQTDFNTLGMQWRSFHDFGVGMEDPNAAQQNAGA